MTRRAPPTHVLWGGYGRGNVGDELALAVAIHDLSRGHERLAVLSPAPLYTRHLFPGVTVVPYDLERLPRHRRYLRRVCRWWAQRSHTRMRLPSLYRPEPLAKSPARRRPAWATTLAGARSLYLVGGGYLTDLFDVDFHLPPLRVAHTAGIPITSGPLGIGPFRSRQAEDEVARALRPASIVVRDPGSLRFCRRHGITARPRPDDGFRVEEVLPGLSPPNPAGAAPSVGVCVFPQHGASDARRTADWWVHMLAELRACAPGVEIRGFCFHLSLDADYRAGVEVFRRAGLSEDAVRPPHLDFRNAIRDLARHDVVVSARFHAAVVAAVMGKRCFAVADGPYYRSKMQAAAAVAPETMRVVNPAGDAPGEVAAQVADACRVMRP